MDLQDSHSLRPLSYGQVWDKGNFFSVPVGDSKGTKTSNFLLTSVPSIDIKTLGGSSPILAKDKN